MTLFYWCLMGTGVLLSSFAGILLKMGSTEIIYDGAWKLFLDALFNWKILVGMSFYFLGSFIFIIMLKKEDISFLQPLFSLVYVITPVLALTILHEQIPSIRWVGVIVILIGVFIVAKS
jgi:drug/metabolite transporter (DMT)-like permease